MLVVSSLISCISNELFDVPSIRFCQFGKEGNFENFDVRWSDFEGANKLGPQNLW